MVAHLVLLGDHLHIDPNVLEDVHNDTPLASDVVGDLATLIHQLGQPLLLLGNARLVLSDLLERRFGLVHLMFEFDNLRGQPQ